MLPVVSCIYTGGGGFSSGPDNENQIKENARAEVLLDISMCVVII